MKRRVTLKRIFHREEWRIAILFDFNEEIKERVRSLPGAAFSISNKCFYIDDNEEHIKLAIITLKDIAEIDISGIIGKQELNNNIQVKSHTAGKEYSDELPQEMRGPGSFGPVEFRIDEKDGYLVIKFLGRYDKEWIEEMKTYGRCIYDKSRREWLLKWSNLTCDSLADFFTSRHIKVQIKKHIVSSDLIEKRKLAGDEVRGKVLNSRALDGLNLLAMHLKENRYSSRTIESYLSALEFFFRYFNDKEPHEIIKDEISFFIYDFIIRLGYSASYQNQMVSAIKTFYSISGKGRVDPEFLDRPRRRRSLPKVFSKDEVSSILNSTRNLKHKLVLWMIYSCGLRRSEVINIRPSDLDRNRGILHIREGKGGVDRIVPVSEKVWEKIDEYIRSYSPREYLFEGQNKAKYSAESVYRIFKDALTRAGIKKEVGVHSLRHSYATHLHETGLDIRYIQELLGHKSTKTTEIYTHVSRRNLVTVRSPIEDMDVK